MPWKMKDGKHEADANGNPIWLEGDKEAVINGGEVLGTITRLNGEAKQYRVAKEAAEKKLQDFEGVDPVAARDALDKISKIDGGQLINAGKVDEVREQVKKQLQAQIDAANTENARIFGVMKTEKLLNTFTSSEFIKNNLNMPPDIAMKAFGDAWDMDKEGRIFAKGPDGQPVMSKKKFGEIASFDEFFPEQIETYPNKASILKGANNGGTGSTGNGGSPGKQRTVTRSEERAMPTADKAAFMKEVREGKAMLVDDPR